VGVALERVADDHLALLRGQRGDRPDHAPYAVALLHHLVRARDAVERLGQRLQPGLRVPRDVERRVVGDAVEPRPERHRRVGGAGQRRIRVDERLLQRVVGRRGRQEALAVPLQRRPVALDDRGERLLVARPRERHETLVRRPEEDPGPRPARRRARRGGRRKRPPGFPDLGDAKVLRTRPSRGRVG
jgi:hypothetical protein